MAQGRQLVPAGSTVADQGWFAVGVPGRRSDMVVTVLNENPRILSVVLDAEEEAVAVIERWAAEERIGAATVSAIGAFRRTDQATGLAPLASPGDLLDPH